MHVIVSSYRNRASPPAVGLEANCLRDAIRFSSSARAWGSHLQVLTICMPKT